MTTVFNTKTVGQHTTVQTTSSVFTSNKDESSQGFPGVAELTELPRFNINHQAELLAPVSPDTSHRAGLQLQDQQEEEEEEEEEEEDIVSSEAFRNCSIKSL